MLLVESRIVLHLSPANGLQSWTNRPPPFGAHPELQLPVGPHTNGTSPGSGAPSALWSPTTHWYVIVRLAAVTCGAFAVATLSASALAMVACRGTLDGEVLGAGERAEVHGVLQHLALVIEPADVDHERHGGEEDHDGERGEDGDGPSLFLQPFPHVGPPVGGRVHCPSNLDSDCEWRFIVVPRPGTKEPIGVIML